MDVDVHDPPQVRSAVAGRETVVVSIKGHDYPVSKAASALIEAEVGRPILVGGGGSLLGPDGQRFADARSSPRSTIRPPSTKSTR